MRTIKKIYIIFLILAITVSLGCGGSGGGNSDNSYSNNPVTPEQDLPTEYVQYSFNEESNVIKNIPANSENIAIDVPVGANYFITITNTSPNPQNISLISSVTASIRSSITDEPQQSILSNLVDSYKYQENADAEIQYRLGFINRLNQKKSSNALRSVRAGISGINHNYEQVGQSYDLWTSDLSGGKHLLNNCKLVAITEHAKFFVDQNDLFGYSCHKELMEKIVTQGDFALTKVFDTDTVNIHQFMSENFGNSFDVDNDGKISIIITPYLSYLNSSFLGLFFNDCMLEDFIEPRDQILLAPPINGQDTNYNRHQAITNLCHEYQHMINFSQRFYRNGVYSFKDDDKENYNNELGFDEGCSVCAEALFRRARGKRGYTSLYDYKTSGSSSIEYTGNDTRFNQCFSNITGIFGNIFPFYTINKGFSYYNYGRNGLFMLYLHDRFGDGNFKKLIQLPFTGSNLKTIIPQTLGTGESFDELQRDWHFALQHEYLKTEQNKNGEEITSDARFKYNEWLKLDSQNKKANSRSINLSSGDTVLYKINPDIANTGNNFRFFIKSTGNTSNKNLDINIIKI